MPDVAIPTRPGQQQEPLRFMLRALSNVINFNPDTDKVWLIGDLPSWAVNVEHIPGNKRGSKGPNILDNWLRFCEHADSDEFLAFNDDMYATRPTAVVADEWQEPLTERCAREPGNGWWARSLRATLDYCSTITPEPKSFELHRPVLMQRSLLADALKPVADVLGEPPQWRSVYGNTHDTGRVQVRDVKTRDHTSVTGPWLSTAPVNPGAAWRHIQKLYPTPSKYERS